MALPLRAVAPSSRKPSLTTPGSPALALGLGCFCDLESRRQAAGLVWPAQGRVLAQSTPVTGEKPASPGARSGT